MIYIFNIIAFTINCFLIKKYLHIYQCKDYNFSRYFNFFKKKHLILMLFYCFFVVFQLFFNFLYFNLLSNLVLLIINLIYVLGLIKNKKTPIKYTNKIKRLYVLSILLHIIFINFKFYIPISFVLMSISPPISNFLNFYDHFKNKHYIQQAKEKLKKHKIKVIAITGSNGKTSVKNILFEMLSLKYKTLKSPTSYNTPLGISKFINESNLCNCEYIILEYGARRKNDIKKLCSLFGADYGIITTISPQHLETFKNINNIISTKNELALYLNNKLCIYNLDNTYTEMLYHKKCGLKSSISIKRKANFYASNITITNGKTYFTIHTKKFNFPCSTNLLGKHNVSNILLCFALAVKLKIDPQILLTCIKNLKPTPHRLELIKTHINILDDSYNCSLSSAREAVDVLKNFSTTKMIVTPGIIECGNAGYEINFKLGEMCSISDYVIIVGEHNKHAILDGLNNKNFSNKKIIYAKNLDDAKQYFNLLPPNSTLLLLNDLPDDYN